MCVCVCVCVLGKIMFDGLGIPTITKVIPRRRLSIVCIVLLRGTMQPLCRKPCKLLQTHTHTYTHTHTHDKCPLSSLGLISTWLVILQNGGKVLIESSLWCTWLPINAKGRCSENAWPPPWDDLGIRRACDLEEDYVRIFACIIFWRVLFKYFLVWYSGVFFLRCNLNVLITWSDGDVTSLLSPRYILLCCYKWQLVNITTTKDYNFM